MEASIETARLRLVPHAPGHWLALIEGVGNFEAQTGLRAAEGLRELLVSYEISPEWLDRLREATAPDPWVHGFVLVEKATGSAIGSAGFKGAPDDAGMVEIAYGVVPGHRGQGFATETAAALVTYAENDPGVRLVRAHTLPEPNASTRVLKKCGFRFVGEVVDPDDGAVWRWERAAGA